MKEVGREHTIYDDSRISMTWYCIKENTIKYLLPNLNTCEGYSYCLIGMNIFFIGIQYQYVIQDQYVNLGGLF
jgi:hypothetical protein